MAFVVGKALDVLSHFVETPTENGNKIFKVLFTLIQIEIGQLLPNMTYI